MGIAADIAIILVAALLLCLSARFVFLYGFSRTGIQN